MAHKTKKKYEEYLNEVGATFESCEYMTNPRRSGKVIKKGSLRNLLNDERYGYVMRKYDPIAFEVGFNEWKDE
jgi:hypothetical protein